MYLCNLLNDVVVVFCIVLSKTANFLFTADFSTSTEPGLKMMTLASFHFFRFGYHHHLTPLLAVFTYFKVSLEKDIIKNSGV